jgi:acetyl-CoA acetyltransferase
LLAFERALDDAGLLRQDIDGLSVMLMEGGEPEEYAKLLGIAPRQIISGGFVGVPAAARAIASGQCDTVALVFSTGSRSVGRVFGGSGSYGGSGRDSYYYYHPWRWSAQAAHWALMARYYMSAYGTTEEDLGRVALTLRHNAILNDNSVMQSPLTMEDYLESRYIVKPLHLFDICLVNDGGVCIIVRRSDMARDAPHTPVLVAGWGYSHVTHDKLHFMVKERLRPQLMEAADQALSMARLSRSDIGHLEVYDASSIHLINQLEGFGFLEAGEGLDFVKDGQMAIGGSLPVNTNGGMISQSYMLSWNNMAEAVKQLRHEAGPRQVEGLGATLFAPTTTEATFPVIFTRGA